MKIKYLIDEDFINYKKPLMFIGTSYCDFKCNKECGKEVCQNQDLLTEPSIEISIEEIYERFISNPLTEAILFGGLEPFFLTEDILQYFDLIKFFCDNKKEVDLIFYTGYYPKEIISILRGLHAINISNGNYCNIIVKFGRFIPDYPCRHDDLLGITLASNNQFAMRLEDCINEYSESKTNL